MKMKMKMKLKPVILIALHVCGRDEPPWRDGLFIRDVSGTVSVL